METVIVDMGYPKENFEELNKTLKKFKKQLDGWQGSYDVAMCKYAGCPALREKVQDKMFFKRNNLVSKIELLEKEINEILLTKKIW